ncbi:MAG: helix-turn-helix transcriptional regulator [Acidaminococcaceae bacterium]|nr:helix-turn-helix transcriptional regulator [Acidaminococcaceae bacterium]
MFLNELMKEKNMTRAELSRKSSIPESTLRDILNGKAWLPDCAARTLVCIAEALDTSVEEIVYKAWNEDLSDWVGQAPEIEIRHDHYSLIEFYAKVEEFRRLRGINDMAFVRAVCECHWIEHNYIGGRMRIALFLMGLVDYLCTKHHKKLVCARYDDIRNTQLDLPVYSIRTWEEGDGEGELAKAREYTEAHAIPELARFNIFMTEEDITPLL